MDFLAQWRVDGRLGALSCIPVLYIVLSLRSIGYVDDREIRADFLSANSQYRYKDATT